VKKQLVLFNGRAGVVYNPRDPAWSTWPDKYRVHAYVAAHSTADAVRLIEEYNGGWPRAASELRTYWSKGTWGRAMDGITPERGIWIATEFSDEKPRRLNTMNEQLEIPLKATPRTRVRLPIDPDDDIPRTAWVIGALPGAGVGFWVACVIIAPVGQARTSSPRRAVRVLTACRLPPANLLVEGRELFVHASERRAHVLLGDITASSEVLHQRTQRADDVYGVGDDVAVSRRLVAAGEGGDGIEGGSQHRHEALNDC
jgi:hypothetical protein